jgi:hypothetical protein
MSSMNSYGQAWHAARGCDNSSMCLQTHRAGRPRPELSTLSLQLMPDALMPHSVLPFKLRSAKPRATRLLLVSHDPHLKEGSPSPNTIGYHLGRHCTVCNSLPQVIHLITSKRRPCEEATLYRVFLFSSFPSRNPVLFPFISPCFQRAHNTLKHPTRLRLGRPKPWPPAVRLPAEIAHDTFSAASTWGPRVRMT